MVTNGTIKIVLMAWVKVQRFQEIHEMNVSQKLIISFSILMVYIVSTTSYYLYNMYESSIIDNKIHDMKDEIVEKTRLMNFFIKNWEGDL